MLHISASVLACKPFEIEKNVKEFAEAGINSIYYDVMDGHYVDAISGNCALCKAISETTPLPIYVHLMVDNPLEQIEQFACCGVAGIAFHPVDENTNKIIRLIKSFEIKAGIAVANDQELVRLNGIDGVDYVVVMTVAPGRCGQTLSPKMAESISLVKAIKPGITVFADGGINNTTEAMVSAADGVVVGSYLFGGELKEQVKKLRTC